MSLHQKTQVRIDAARYILEATDPMTVRQVYYQLVSRQISMWSDLSEFGADVDDWGLGTISNRQG